MKQHFWKPLFLGEHTTKAEGNDVALIGHTSSVSVICDGGKIILIDTGNRHMWKKVQNELRKIDVKINDITDVVLTHFHLDHSGNIACLPRKTRIYAWQHCWTYGKTTRLPSMHGYKITKNVTIYNTPGHTPEHNAILYKNNGKNIIFSGDAINEHYFHTRTVKALNANNTQYKKSAEWIIKNADLIVPGHGPILENQ